MGAGQMNRGVYGSMKKDGERQAGTCGWGHGNLLNWVYLWRCCHTKLPP